MQTKMIRLLGALLASQGGIGFDGGSMSSSWADSFHKMDGTGPEKGFNMDARMASYRKRCRQADRLKQQQPDGGK